MSAKLSRFFYKKTHFRVIIWFLRAYVIIKSRSISSLLHLSLTASNSPIRMGELPLVSLWYPFGKPLLCSSLP